MSGLRMILVSYDPLHASAVEALVQPGPVHEEFLHYHWLATTYALKRARPSLVKQESKVNSARVRFLLHVLAVGKGECLPESSILRSRFVLERSSRDHWRLVPFGNVHRVPRIRHFDTGRSSMDDVMGWMMGDGRHHSVYSESSVRE